MPWNYLTAEQQSKLGLRDTWIDGIIPDFDSPRYYPDPDSKHYEQAKAKYSNGYRGEEG